MHAQSGKSRGVVTPVMERMEMAIQKLAHVGDALNFPRVHYAMDAPTVDAAPITHGKNPQSIENRFCCEIWIELGERPNAPEMAAHDLSECADHC